MRQQTISEEKFDRVLSIVLLPTLQIFKHLKEEEIEELTLEIANTRSVTPQVKEEVITRWGELGMKINGGKLCFKPDLLCKKEFDSNGALSFTRFAVPFTYKLNNSIDGCKITVDGTSFENEISKETSEKLFAREGDVKEVTVEVPEKWLKGFKKLKFKN